MNLYSLILDSLIVVSAMTTVVVAGSYFAYRIKKMK